MGLLDRLSKAASALRGEDEEEQSESQDTGEDDAPTAAQMATVLKRVGLPDPTEEKPRALFHDPYAVLDWGGWREKPNAITYETLRQMAAQCIPITAIIQVRSNQVAAFCRPQQGRYDRGYRVILRDRRDQRRAMSDQETLQAAEIERMLETTGFLQPDEKPSDRDSFKAFVKKAVRDTLIYDQFVWEKIRDRKGRVSRFIALPSETIRPAVADIEHIDAQEMRQRVSHVQVYEDTVIAEFSPDDIAWCVMNPRSDLRASTFGLSPVEQLLTLITAWLFGFQYNTKFFTQGANIKGLLNIKGSIPDRQLKAFRRMWYSMVAGVGNAWRTPILNSEDIQWVPMHSTNSEMEYAAWMDWLTKLICGVFGIDPLEINFIFGNTGQKAALNQARPNEDQVVESKDKGLTPLVEFIEDCINQHIIWELNPDFEFAFTGLNAKEEKQQREGWIAQAKSYKTVDEIRAEQDLDPLPEKKGEVILDSVWLQASQGAAGGQGGPEGGGSGEPGGGPLEKLGEGDEEQEDQEQGEDNPDEEQIEKPEAPAGEEGETEKQLAQRTAKSIDAVLGNLSKVVGTKHEALRKGRRRIVLDIGD